MVAIKPAASTKPEEVVTNIQPNWRKWFYIGFAVVAYFLITAAIFHSHKLMTHSNESLLHRSSDHFSLLTSESTFHKHGHNHHHGHHHHNHQLNHGKLHNGKDWDFLIFTQHWPNTVCYFWEEKKPSAGCNFPKDKDAWSIHGIWPTRSNTMGPLFCNNTPFDQSQLEPIMDELNQYWLDVELGRPKNDLWKHEWRKHGTCAMADPPLDSELKYFSQGLEWFKKYNMENVLGAYSIKPKGVDETGFNVNDIWQAVIKTLGKKPVIRCEKDQATQKTYLFEIRICFDKNLELQDCDGAKVSHRYRDFADEDAIHTNCPLSEPILYPSITARSSEDQLHLEKKQNLVLSELKEMQSLIKDVLDDKAPENKALST